MALTATPEHLDKSRCIQIAIVHDLAESIVGDITPTQFSGISKEQKHQMEKDAIHKIGNVNVKITIFIDFMNQS